MEYMFVMSPSPATSRSQSPSQAKKDHQKVDSMIKSHAARMAIRCRLKDAGAGTGTGIGTARMLTPEKYSSSAGEKSRDSMGMGDAISTGRAHVRQKQARTRDENAKWRVYRAGRTKASPWSQSSEDTEGDDQQQHQQQGDEVAEIIQTESIPPALSIISHQVPKHLRLSVQFLLKTFCPALHSPRYLAMTPHDATRRRAISAFILHNEIAFFGTLSVASAVRDVLLFGDFPLTRQRATCERVIVHLLREALRRDDVPAELLVWAIYTQTALHWLRREYAEAEFHAKAIRTIASSSCSSNGPVKASSPSPSSSLDTETSTPWTVVSYQEYDHARLAVLDMERADPSIWGPMLYPSHPFAAETCAKLATLPPGLTALCLTGSISHPVINALTMISENLRSASPISTTLTDRARNFDMRNRINAAVCIRLLQSFALSRAEQVLLLGVSAYCYFRGGEPATWQNADGFIQVGCLRLIGQPVPDMDATAMLWEGMVLRAAYGYDTPAREYSDVMLRQVMRCRPELFAERYRVAERFFWDRGLSDILERVPF